MLNRASRDNWENDGSPDLRERARQKALHILAAHRVPELPAQLIETAEEVISGYEADVGVAARA